MRIKLSSITDSPHRLREVVQDEAFYELVESLRQQGLLQPIKVRPNNGGYELVYGHRRIAAMRFLGWTECEAIVEDVNDEQATLQAVTENIHRKDLDVLEEAQIYQALRDKGYTISQIAKMVSKPDGRISNRLSLLRLPSEVQEMVRPSHNQQVSATALGAISVDSASRISAAAKSPDEASQMARKAIQERLTAVEVRQLTGQLKQATTHAERQNIIQRPFHSLAGEDSPRSEDKAHFPSRPFHTATRSIAEQFHSKWLWNLSRIDLTQFDHFTIGYSQRDWSQVQELLQLARVTVLVDARRNPVSQYKPEFSKFNLLRAVEAIGIAYRHIPELGIGSEDRMSLAATHNYDKLFDTYDHHLTPELLKDILGESLEKDRLAFLCVELDPNTCHRHRIALRLEEMGYPTFDL